VRSVPLRVLDVRLFGRHQVAAVVATMADFGAMVVLVELTRLSPPSATVLSAVLGGVVNFTLARLWAFRELHRGSVASQATRYGFVSLGGALLNAGLLAIALRLGSDAVPYVLARVGVSILVSFFYTYPMHTRFVFRVAGGSPKAPGDAVEMENVVP